MYIVHESIGNFSADVFESDDFYEVQDYLNQRYGEYLFDNKLEDTEIESSNFYSYFMIKEEKDEKK